MIDMEKLKPILKDSIAEDQIADVILKVTEIDEAVDDKSEELRVANEELSKLRDTNKKLTNMFFTGQKDETINTNNLPDEQAEEQEEDPEPETFDDLFESHDYDRKEDKLNG